MTKTTLWYDTIGTAPLNHARLLLKLEIKLTLLVQDLEYNGFVYSS